MSKLVHLILRYGIPLVWVNVFLEQIGAPVPAMPTLIVAGALTRNGQMSSTHLLVAAVVASLIADYVWFLLGRIYGFRILRLLCRISLSPDSCVRDTEAKFEKWGLKSLLVAKFIPGFSTVAPPLMGAVGKGGLAFIFYDAIGAFLWAATGIVTGRIFHTAIGRVLRRLEDLGCWAVVIVLSILALIIAYKWWQRLRFYKELRMARVTADELKGMFDRGEAPIVLDVRTPTARKAHPQRIPGALVAKPDEIAERIADVPPHREIILYCT